MHNFTVAITNGSYIYQLQSSHNQIVHVKSIKGNHISVAYIRLKTKIFAIHIETYERYT